LPRGDNQVAHVVLHNIDRFLLQPRVVAASLISRQVSHLSKASENETFVI
jgi:hypothetical protein